MQIITLLSKYKIDCILVAFIDCFATYILKKKIKSVPSKINGVLPFCIALIIYLTVALIRGGNYDDAVSSSMSAGGLATIIYAFLGGYKTGSEEELNELMTCILKNMVADEKLSKVAKEIIEHLNADCDEQLIIVRISDLIKANLQNDASDEKVMFVSRLFIDAFNSLKLNKKTK